MKSEGKSGMVSAVTLETGTESLVVVRVRRWKFTMTEVHMAYSSMHGALPARQKPQWGLLGSLDLDRSCGLGMGWRLAEYAVP